MTKSWLCKNHIPRYVQRFKGTTQENILIYQIDQQRLNYLINAISEKNSSYIWALRGGYGSDRLIPSLVKLLNPSIQKRLIGYSDITALHLFLSQSMGLENHTWCGWKRIDRR